MDMPMFRPLRHLRPLALALLFVPTPALAQASDPQVIATVQALFNQAVEEMGKKRYESACPRLEQATRMLPEAMGAKEMLAQCHEAAGKLASAWAQYGLLESMASRAGQSERATKAAAKAAELKPRLATLTVAVPDSVRALPGIVVARDGLAFAEALWGTALPVDTGEHVLLVTATGHRAWSSKIVVTEDGTHREMKVPLLEIEVASTPPVAEVPASRSWQRPLGIAVAALGAVGLGTGGLLAGLALGKKSASNEASHCDPRNTCDEIGLALRHQAVGLGNGATAALVAGGVLAAGGVVLLITAPSRGHEPGKTAKLRWDIAISPTRVGVQGAW